MSKGEVTNKICNALMVGQDFAGKTSILIAGKMPGEEITTTIPTIGFNVETVTSFSTNLTVWDITGSRIKTYWPCYYQNLNSIIWVEDCHDDSAIDLSKRELFSLLSSEDLKGYPLLVFANKQDLPNAYDAMELINRFNLHSLDGERPWRVFNTIATDNYGLQEGFNWLHEMVNDPTSYVPQINFENKNANKI